MAQHELPQYYPYPGWVEQDPREIASTQLGVMSEVLISSDILPEEIDSIGIGNQRETTIIWDRKTGEPITNAIVWQCRRTTDIIEELFSDEEKRELVHEKTGLIPDAYFSASKIKWILDTVPHARERACKGELAFGTVDTWLIWCLTQGKVHATDVTNASRTMLFNIKEGCWDKELLELFDIPEQILPQVQASSSYFGTTSRPGIPEGIPICGVAGDQQAALFGQNCVKSGSAKNTYGTGCFMLMHTGKQAVMSKHGLITTIAASSPENHELEYALEGSVFVSGALIQWLRDELGIIKHARDSEEIAKSVPDSLGVVIVPAFTGLGAPYWDTDARGAMYGLTRGSNRAHIVRAALESIAYQVHDVARTMEKDSGCVITQLNVDGGASSNNFLMQFQSDILDTELCRPHVTESTAAGAAYLAGLSTGFWCDVNEIIALRLPDTYFHPNMEETVRMKCLSQWHQAVERTKTS